jgi:hypothetical protein
LSIYRTMLFAPANDLRKAGKALMLNADGTVLDLEDAVALSEKANAREALKEILHLPRRGDLFIRVNSVQTEFILSGNGWGKGIGYSQVRVCGRNSPGGLADRQNRKGTRINPRRYGNNPFY